MYLDDLKDDTFFDTSLVKPSYNIALDEDGSTVIELAVPGFTKEEITIKTLQDGIQVQGTKEENKLKYGAKYFFTTGKFTRFFELNESPNTYDIVAKLENGLLTIRLKTKEEIEKSSTIEIQ